MSLIESVKLVSVYLTPKCNFDCSYCDRSFVRTKKVGNAKNTDSIVSTLSHFPNLTSVSFHGGEPLLMVDTIASVIDQLDPKYKVVITTNGSLILDNREFFTKYRNRLSITLSYDLEFQEHNRSAIPIKEIKSFLSCLGIPVMLQCVLPNDPIIATPEFFVRNWPDIQGCSINIIPLRHHRGKEKFTDFFGPSVLPNFVPLVNALYNYNTKVIVDGCYESINKDYLGAHNKVILSPDGKMYTEYDFLEYRMEHYSVGTWYPEFTLAPSKPETVWEQCTKCPEKNSCGIKHLYKEFDVKPNAPACMAYYHDCTKLIEHTTALRNQPSFYNHLQPKQDDFVSKDGLRSLKELSFSLLETYDCWAGCKVCYVRDMIGNIPKLPKQVPNYGHVFECYNKVTVSDDLYHLYHNAPELFDWYVANQSKFWFGSFTDNALFRSLPLFGKFLGNSKGLHEITLSEAFCQATYQKLQSLLSDYRPRIIKYIGKNLPDWLAQYAIGISAELHYQPDIQIDRNEFGDTTYISQNGLPFTRLSESDFLQGDKFYLTTVDCIKGTGAYNTVSNFDPESHLFLHLNAKLKRYEEYNHPYFSLAVRNYRANREYNYIPKNLLGNDNGFYHSMIKAGWIATELGLLSPNVQDEVISLCSKQ